MIFTGTVGSVLTFSSEKIISAMNNIFVFLIIVAFSGLITIGLPRINFENYYYQDYNSVLKTIPIMLVALVFHNIVPVICSKLQYKKKDIRTAIICGSLIPLLMFIIWNAGNHFLYFFVICHFFLLIYPLFLFVIFLFFIIILIYHNCLFF